ncbi:MAG: polysaccharide biosynthesis/export family protein [Bacteroidales bacterium]|nr:polysaccharide biosynthesis/export family protein [Bacteroidales bacterium]
MTKHNKIAITLIIFGILSIILSSCTPVSKLKYLQREKSSENDTIKVASQPYLLQKGDNIYIDIKTSNPEMRMLLTGKPSETNQTASINPSSLFLISYLVDDNWNIELPLIGSFNCRDKTSDQLKDDIETTLKKFVTDAIVSVKLVNTNITVLGEVNRPGQFFTNQKQTNLIDALGMAGDLTMYGNRKNITVMRKLQSGDYKTYSLDITKSKVISHEAFMLMPNDIVYVEPMRTKPFGLAVFPYGTIFSAITTIVVLFNFLKN